MASIALRWDTVTTLGSVPDIGARLRRVVTLAAGVFWLPVTILFSRLLHGNPGTPPRVERRRPASGLVAICVRDLAQVPLLTRSPAIRLVGLS